MAKNFQKHNLHHLFMAFALAIAISAVTFLLPFFKSGLEYSVSADSNVIHISSRWGQLGSPDIAMSQFGDTVMVWEDSGGKSYEIFGQSFDSNRNPFGSTKKLNHYRPNDQRNPRIAMDEIGNYIVVWQSYEQDGSESGIYGQRFSYEGIKTGSEFKINTYIIGNQVTPAVAMSKTGEFVVTWVSDGQDGTGKSIFAQIFGADGKKAGEEFRVNTHNAGIQETPAVVIDENGNIMIVWQNRSGDDMADGWDIYGRLFKKDGKVITDEDFIINKTNQFNQQQPDVEAIGGKFMVVWNNTKQHEVLENLVENVEGRIISNAGIAIGNEFEVSPAILGHQENPKLTAVSSGKIITVWEDYDRLFSEVKNWNISTQTLNASGGKIGEKNILNTSEYKWNKQPAITSDGRGNTDVIWTGLNNVPYKKALHYLRRIGDE